MRLLEERETRLAALRQDLKEGEDSGIRNDPNDWSDDPQYIISLVKRIVRVSLETMKIVNALPALNEREGARWDFAGPARTKKAQS